MISKCKIFASEIIFQKWKWFQVGGIEYYNRKSKYINQINKKHNQKNLSSSKISIDREKGRGRDRLREIERSRTTDWWVGLKEARWASGFDSDVINWWLWQRRDWRVGLKEATTTRLVCRSEIVLASRRTLSFFTTTLTSSYQIGFSNSLSASFFAPPLRSPEVRSHRLGSTSPRMELRHWVGACSL